MKKKSLFYFMAIFNLALISHIFTMTGKLAPPIEIIINTHKDKETRQLGFFEFINESEVEDISYLTIDIPKTIYTTIKKYTNITIKDQFIPVIESNFSFDKVAILLKENNQETTNTKIEKILITNQNLSGRFDKIVTNLSTNQSNTKKISSELYLPLDTAQARTNQNRLENYFLSNQLAFVITNETPSNLIEVVYHFHPYNKKIIDTKNKDFSSNQLTNGLVLLQEKQSNQMVIFRSPTNKQRKLEVLNLILKHNQKKIKGLFYELSKNKMDFAVIGSFKATSKNALKLSILIINRGEQTITEIYNTTVKPENLFQELIILPELILSKIQEKQIVSRLKFSSEPSGAFIYLDNVYQGRTPFTLNSYPQGISDFKIWHPDGIVDTSFSPNSNILLSKRYINDRLFNQNTNEVEVIRYFSHIKVNKNLNDKEIKFKINKRTNLIPVNLKIKKPKEVEIYLNNKLVSITNKDTLYVKEGKQFISFKRTNYQTMYIALDPNAKDLLDITASLRPVRKKTKFEKVFFDFNRNSLILGGLTATLSLLTLTAYILQTDNLTKFQTSEEGALFRERYLVFRNISQNLAIASASGLVLTVTSKIIDVSIKAQKVYHRKTRNNPFFEIKISKKFN